MNYLVNTEAALEAWQSVPRDAVRLSTWECGSVHCFGGWLPYFEHFKNLGVKAGRDGIPTMTAMSGFSLSYELFGCYGLFKPAEWWEAELTDWQVINERLKEHRDRLLKGADHTAKTHYSNPDPVTGSITIRHEDGNSVFSAAPQKHWSENELS